MRSKRSSSPGGDNIENRVKTGGEVTMKKIVRNAVVVYSLGVSPVLPAYDAALAEKFHQLFSQAKGAETGEALQLMGVETFIDDLKAGRDFLVVDIRTPAETAVLGLTIPSSIKIPLDSLFKNESLERIPVDRPVVIVCKSGIRATAAGVSLRHLGFDNVYVLSGGFQALSRYYGTGQAYPEDKIER